MISSAQQLPPKMALQFAERAKRGEADFQHGNTFWLFYQGSTEVCLLHLDPPFGHIKRQSPDEIRNRKYGKEPA